MSKLTAAFFVHSSHVFPEKSAHPGKEETTA